MATAIVFTLCFALGAAGQTTSYSSEASDYTFELPSPTWRETGRQNGAQEFVYGDRLDGYLRVRKEVVDSGTTANDVAFRDKDQNLRFRPGYVNGKQEPFAGKFSGAVVSYEFTSAGKPMVGRVYYLQADPRTIYTLHFTGMRDKLTRIRNQTDIIARTFRRK